MKGTGFLAIWSDLAPEDETDWAHWMTREHSSERLQVEGFLACRVFRALGTTMNRYFILYDLEQPAVVASPEYLARLNAPTPWSQRIMPRLRNFARGGGRIAATCGIGQGGVVAILPLLTKPEWELAGVCGEIATLDKIVACRVLLTDEEQTSIQTQEKTMREGDRSFAGLLLVEGLTATALRTALWRLQSIVPAFDKGEIEGQPLYTAMFSLDKPKPGPAPG
jgi:hypothetical protein